MLLPARSNSRVGRNWDVWRRFGCMRLQHHAAGHADAENVHPALVKIEQMRIEQRCDDILRHDQKADPARQGVAAEQSQMNSPKRKQRSNADDAPLHGDIEGLIVWIADDLPARQHGGRGGSLLEQASG